VIAPVDEGDLHVHGREHGRVLAPDDPCAENGERLGEPIDHQDRVRVVHVLVVEGDIGRLKWLRTRRDEEALRREANRRHAESCHLDRVRIEESRDAAEHLDPVSFEVPLDARDLELAYGVLARQEPRHRDLGVHVHGHSVELALPVAREKERRLAQCLGRQCPRVDGRAAGLRFSLDDGDSLAEVRRLNGPLFARGAGAHHDQIEVVGHARRR
jgi:hypothetical protein